jgi:hypothetical protein
MRRVFLGVGDRAGSAVIIEGLPSVTCSNPPPEVHISTLYMKTYCSACGKEGFIAPQGFRWDGTGPNGQQWALSGDINVCGCSPAPVFHAERNMAQIFDVGDGAMLTGRGANAATSNAMQYAYDEQFTLRDGGGRVLQDTYYTVRLPSGELIHGVTDGAGRTARYATDGAQRVAVYIGHREA